MTRRMEHSWCFFSCEWKWTKQGFILAIICNVATTSCGAVTKGADPGRKRCTSFGFGSPLSFSGFGSDVRLRFASDIRQARFEQEDQQVAVV